MLVHVEIVFMFFFSKKQGEACKDQIYFDKTETPCSISQRRVRLRAVLVNFESSKKLNFFEKSS